VRERLMRGKHLAVLTVVLWAGSAAAQSVDPQALMDQLLRRQMREFQRQDAERQQQQREADKLWYWTGEPLEQRELDHRLAKDKYECLQEAARSRRTTALPYCVLRRVAGLKTANGPKHPLI
jgi:tRNA A37 N6-isopentenylltransferase MiaA